MNVNQINQALFNGSVDQHGVFPHLDSLKSSSVVFNVDFGLSHLPTSPGIIFIRGPRQYGKSTWLESQLRNSIIEHGAGSAFYLNGDELRNSEDLINSIRTLLTLFSDGITVKRLFIDEITAVENWQRALKRLADAGELRDILVITTGSKATDLRRSSERLPGRKGKLDRTTYYFTPLPYVEFKRGAESCFGADTVFAYLLTGGCPIAAVELITTGLIPEFIIEMIKDWIYGECTASGRNRASLIGIMDVLIKCSGSPCGQAKIARDAGLANNSIAAGYLELLMDLMCINTSYLWDKDHNKPIMRKPAKHHFVNVLAALCWHPEHIRSIDDFKNLKPDIQGTWLEWIVAQELWRRSAVGGDDLPEVMLFWKSDNNEIDFVSDSPLNFFEVKRGKVSPLEYTWFPRIFPGQKLTIINSDRFETSFCKGVTLEGFLLGE